MIKPTKLAHVVFRTRRFEEMVEWYLRTLGAHVQYRNELLAFLSYDDEHHRIALINLTAIEPDGKTPADPLTATVDHVSYTFASVQDLVALYKQLKRLEIKPYWLIHHGMTISFYYADPDGNQVEFQVDCFATSDEAVAYMQTDAYATNPIGVEMKPDDFVARVESGADLQTLRVRPAGPMPPIRNAANPSPLIK